MALKKPSDFFNKKTSLDRVHETLVDAAPEKIENLTEAFQVFKTNLNNVQTLSEFSSTINEFKENFERVELLSKEIEEIKESVGDSLKKKDLDEAMVSHLLFVEKSIEDVQKKVKSLNSKTLYDIKEEFQELQEIVSDFVDREIPSYKKQVLDHERRIDNRFLSFKENVNQNIEKIDEEVALKISTITETISSINQNHLNQFKEEVLSLEEKVDYLLEDELPKYKKFFADTELKAEEKINIINLKYKI